jgi:pyruvate-formate lyase-activating enzyme
VTDGVIFDIQRYSIHDGPGIRTVVFFRGCPLRCLWCSNPEGQQAAPAIEFFAARCQRCGRCVEACPRAAVNRDALVDAQRHPERYPDLIVRVGGYSARFVDLSAEVQETVIGRAEGLP